MSAMLDWKTAGAVALTLVLFVFILGDNATLRDFLVGIGEKLGGLTLPIQLAQTNRTVAIDATLQQMEPDNVTVRSATAYVAVDKLKFNGFDGMVRVTFSSSSVELDGKYNALQYESSNVSAGSVITVKTSLVASAIDVVNALPGNLYFTRTSGSIITGDATTGLKGYGLRIDEFAGNVSYVKPNLMLKGVAKSVRIDTGRQAITIS